MVKKPDFIGYVGLTFLGAIIGIIAVAWFGNPIESFFNPPKAVPVALYQNDFCPNGFTFDSVGEPTFKVAYRNQSKFAGNFTATLTPNTLSVKVNDHLSQYSTFAAKSWTIPPGSVAEFDFRLKKNTEKFPGDVNITLDLTCYNSGRPCPSLKNCCNYENKDPNPYAGSHYFDLVSETC